MIITKIFIRPVHSRNVTHRVNTSGVDTFNTLDKEIYGRSSYQEGHLIMHDGVIDSAAYLSVRIADKLIFVILLVHINISLLHHYNHLQAFSEAENVFLTM